MPDSACVILKKSSLVPTQSSIWKQCHQRNQFTISSGRTITAQEAIFPAQGFLELIVSVLRFLDSNISVAREWPRAKRKMIALLTPRVEGTGRITCGCEDEGHSRDLINTTVTKLVSIFLGNYAKTQSDLEDMPKYHNKPLSRKVLKL